MRDASNIFLHFLNRDTQDIFGLTYNNQFKTGFEKLRKALNASVLLCSEENYCLLPVGFWFESNLTRDLLKQSEEYIKNGYIRFSTREDNLFEFIDKKRSQYSGLQKRTAGQVLYDNYYEKSVFEELLALDPVLIDRKTKIGRSCSEMWGYAHKSLIEQNSGDLLKVYSNLDKCDLLTIAPKFQDIVRDPEKPFVWANVSETIYESRIKDLETKKRLRSYFEKNYYTVYLQEYNATLLHNFYLLDKGLDFGLDFPNSSINNYVWFESFLSALSLENILSTSSAKIVAVKQSDSWGILLQKYIDLCNDPHFQNEVNKRKSLCVQACSEVDIVKHIENIKEILKMQKETIPKQRNNKLDVLIMVATVEEENAIIDSEEWEYKQTEEGYGYYYHVEGLTFALARSVDMGPTSAASAAQYFVNTLRPRFLSMAGFCAGKKGEVNLGDVFVPNKVYDYEGGKQKSKNLVLPDLNLSELDPLWRQKIERFDEAWRDTIKLSSPIPYGTQKKALIELLRNQSFALDIDLSSLAQNASMPDIVNIVTDEIDNKNLVIQDDKIVATPDGKTRFQEEYLRNYLNYQEPKLQIRMGALATGTKVQQWDQIFDKLSRQYERKTYAIDMEGAAITAVAKFQHMPCLIAKGVGDFASGSKAFDNRYLNYAVYSSYRFIVAFYNSLHGKELLGK